MKTKDIKRFIDKADSYYSKFASYINNIQLEAEKHIDWANILHCDYLPGDGLCIVIETNDGMCPHACPAHTFFDYVKELPEPRMISYDEYLRMCI
jgi:hypothetical protein